MLNRIMQELYNRVFLRLSPLLILL